MARSRRRVRVSSKGQIVIPADVRRELGIESGRTLTVRRQGREIVLSLDLDERDVEEQLKAIRALAKKLAVDPVAELHERRRREREQQRG